MSAAMLFLDAFGYSIDGTSIFADLGFTVEKGGYLSIIGPNGAGKSTLLKALMRLHDVGKTQGKASIKGRNLEAYSQKELAQNLAYVPQAGGRIPPFSVEEFLKLSRYPYAAHKEALRPYNTDPVKKALRLTGLETYAGRRLDTLSGGERQRAYLAAALAQETEIMLLDEPASFLDPRHASEVNRLLKTLNKEQGITMITVTHDLSHPLDAGGKALVMRQGKQIFFGEADCLAVKGILEDAFAHTFTRICHPLTGKTIILPDQM